MNANHVKVLASFLPPLVGQGHFVLVTLLKSSLGHQLEEHLFAWMPPFCRYDDLRIYCSLGGFAGLSYEIRERAYQIRNVVDVVDAVRGNDKDWVLVGRKLLRLSPIEGAALPNTVESFSRTPGVVFCQFQRFVVEVGEYEAAILVLAHAGQHQAHQTAPRT